MTDLITFITDTAALITVQLPLQSLDSAAAYVSSYLSNTGGWIPTDHLFPTGEGLPANGFTEQQMADAITSSQFSQVYDINFNVQVTLNVQMALKLSSGLDLDEATVAMTSAVEDFVTTSINNSILPLRLDDVISVNNNHDGSDVGGDTTAATRVVISAEISGSKKITDYRAIALKYAQDTYGIDDTWNVQSVYTEIGNPLVVIIAKYNDDILFDTLDPAAEQIYVFNISRITYEIISGEILNLE